MDTDLRPLSLGEILDRTFQLYRSHFLMFAGISSFAAGLDLVWKLIQTGIIHMVGQHVAVRTLGLMSSGFALVNLVIYIIVGAVAMAAINRAVSAIYLGQQTGIAQAYGEVKAHWFRYVWLYVVATFLAWGATIVVFSVMMVAVIYLQRQAAPAEAGLAVVGIFGLSLFVLVPFGVWMMLRYSLANAACVFEDLGIRASLKRSVFLSKGAAEKGRIFVMFLLAAVISAIITYAGLTPLMIVVFKSITSHHPSAISLGMTIYTQLIGFLTSSVTIPIYGIGLTLFYYDARIRKEGFDVEWMMHRATPIPLTETPALPPVEPSLG